MSFNECYFLFLFNKFMLYLSTMAAATTTSLLLLSSNLHNKWMLILLCQRFWSSAGKTSVQIRRNTNYLPIYIRSAANKKKTYYILGTCMVIKDSYIVRLENLKLNVHIVSSPPTPRKSNQHHYRHHHVCQRLLTLSSTYIYPSAQRGNYRIQCYEQVRLCMAPSKYRVVSLIFRLMYCDKICEKQCVGIISIKAHWS